MGWDEVNTNAIDIKKDVEKIYEGTFVGSKNFETKIGLQVLWKFTNEESGDFQIYGFTNLNRYMENVSLGDAIQIQYKGTEKVLTKYGLKDVHQVSVKKWVDDVVQKIDDDIKF